MSDIFADSFYYIALLNPSDRYHDAAVEATRAVGNRLVTTRWVLTEVADALSSPKIRCVTYRFLEQVDKDPDTLVVEADAVRYARGVKLFGSRPDKAWSLTDCISFEVMNEYGLTEALTADRHFEQAGFRALLLPPPTA